MVDDIRIAKFNQWIGVFCNRCGKCLCETNSLRIHEAIALMLAHQEWCDEI